MPPRPKAVHKALDINEQGNMEFQVDDAEQKEWDAIFGKKQLVR